MSIIELTQGKFALISNRDVARVNQYSWWADRRRKIWYARGEIEGKLIYLHRFILDLPPGSRINHKDGNGLNCTRGNMIRCTNQQNCWAFQTKRGRTSRYRGVSWFKRDSCWRAYLVLNGKQFHLGYFDDEKEAARSYDRAARKYFKGFASPNFK